MTAVELPQERPAMTPRLARCLLAILRDEERRQAAPLGDEMPSISIPDAA